MTVEDGGPGVDDEQLAPRLSRHIFRFDGPQIEPDPEHLQAAVSRWLDDCVDDVYTRLSPHDAAAKGWAAWWRATEGGGELEVGVAHDALAARLRGGMKDQERIVLGRDILFLREPAEAPVETAEWSWIAAPEPRGSLSVRFLAPTTLRSQKRYTPWLQPASLLSSLTARWAAFAPADVGFPNPTLNDKLSLWVSSVDGRTELRTLRGPVPGFVGEITYEGDDPRVMARFTALFRMAEFLGAGARTEYGFGRVRLVPGPHSVGDALDEAREWRRSSPRRRASTR